jgi:hypothetical protein
MSIPSRQVRFDYLDGLTFEVRQADLEVNPLFAAATIAWIQPLQLASSLPEGHPRKLSEERANAAMVKVYAMAIIWGNPDPSAEAPATPEVWEAWLLEHPDEFLSVREVAGDAEAYKDQRLEGAA